MSHVAIMYLQAISVSSAAFYLVMKYSIYNVSSASRESNLSKMLKKKGLTKQQIESLFEESDSEDENLDELFSEEELAQANEEPIEASGSDTVDDGSLDLPFDLDEDDDGVIEVRSLNCSWFKCL